MTIEIEKGVPLPKRSRGPGRPRSGKYPFQQMEVGDSFLISNVASNSVACISGRWAKRTGFKFSQRKVEGGYRVWRVA